MTMKIPFGTITVTDKSKDLITEILSTGRLSCGKYVREFEKSFASLIGTRESVTVSSGTDADILALAVLYDYGAKRGDEVIVPALSFVATANAVLHAGLTPVFVDIDRRTLNINPELIEDVITERTRAIMPVHLMGKPADMDQIIKIAEKYSLYVIEDAAEAHGAVYKGVNAGAIGDMGAFSLYVAHIISTVEGGIITTDDPDMAEILRSLRSHGRACKCKTCVLNRSDSYCSKRFNYGENNDIRFIFERIGYSSKMNELEACIGLGNLEIYNNILHKRRQNLYYLIDHFKKFSPYLYTIQKEPYEEIGPHALPIIIQQPARFTRNQMVEFFEERGIDTRNLFSSIPTQCHGFSFLGYRHGEFPEAEYVGDNGIHIGVHQDIGKEECDYILYTIHEFLERYAW